MISINNEEVCRNVDKQREELETLKLIFNDYEIIIIKNDEKGIDGGTLLEYSIEMNHKQISRLHIKCPLYYPSKVCPIFDIHFTTAFMMNNDQQNRLSLKKEIANDFESIWNEKKAEQECVIFECLSALSNKKFANEMEIKHETKENKNVNITDIALSATDLTLDMNQPSKVDIIWCTQKIEDKKSIFRSYIACVSNTEEIESFLSQLQSNKKIANATHNMYAYRIQMKESSVLMMNEYFNDDGEHGGGRVILEILQKRNICNRIILVSRWFGGILLHSNRFKDIKKCTQLILDEEQNVQRKQSPITIISKKRRNKNSRSSSAISISKKPNKNVIRFGIELCDQLLLLFENDENKNGSELISIHCKCINNNTSLMSMNLNEYSFLIKHRKENIEWIESVWCKQQLMWTAMANGVCSKSKKVKKLNTAENILSIQKKISNILYVHQKKIVQYK